MPLRAHLSGVLSGVFALTLASAEPVSITVKRTSPSSKPVKIEIAPAANTSATSLTSVLPVAIQPFQGQNGNTLTQHLHAALQESRNFRLMNGGRGLPVVTGKVTSDGVEGKLLGPNGKRLFSRRYDSGNPRIDARRFADDVTLQLTKRPGIASSQIAFVAPRGNGARPEICLCDADGRNLRQLTKDGRGNRAPSISPDGSRILYTATGNGRASLLLYDLVDGSLKPVQKDPSAYAVGAISPDNRQAAMAAGPSAQASDLFIIDLKSGKSRRLTESPLIERSPAWSPDGESLVYSATNAIGQTSLFLSETGRKPKSKPLNTGLANSENPDWSPDGDRIAFNALDPSTRQPAIFVLELGTNRVRKIAPGTEPAWGADSRHLVYVGAGGLYIADAFSGQTHQIVGNMGPITNPTWTR